MQNIEIQAGKRYVMRNGEITGYIKCDAECNHCYWRDDTRNWQRNGARFYDEEASIYDIIAEYTEPSKATETEREITRMVKEKGLDPAVWCWVGVDKSNCVLAYKQEPKLVDLEYYYVIDCKHKYIGCIDCVNPTLYKFNPFYDEE